MFFLVAFNDEQNLGNVGTWTNLVSFLELKHFNVLWNEKKYDITGFSNISKVDECDEK